MFNIDHPFLVNALDYIIQKNEINIIMEYFPKSSLWKSYDVKKDEKKISSATLWNYLNEKNPVSPEFIKRIFLCSVDGLYYLKKQHGMNHRDIKP